MNRIFYILLLLVTAFNKIGYGQASPTCITTSASWNSQAGSATYGINAFSITGYLGSNLSDAGLTSAVDASGGYLSRVASVAAVNLRQGGTFAASGTWGTIGGNQFMGVWIDFNDNGTFENTEAVCPVSGNVGGTVPQPTTFSITIPAAATPGIHLMRMRGIWQQNSTSIGSMPTTISPCNVWNGSNPRYWSGTCVDYKVNIIPLAPPAPTLTGGGNYCVGGTITLTASSTATSPTFTWSGPGITSYTGATLTISSATAAAAGSYTCFVTSAGTPGPTASTSVVVNPVPAAITGTATVCEGISTTLSTTSTGGTWSSGNVAVGTVLGGGSFSTVTGVAAGTVQLSYSFSTGCAAVRVVTVHATPVAVPGIASLCEAGTVTLTHPESATGTWSSGTPLIATIGLTSGIVNGLSGGYAAISFTNANGCVRTRQVTVNALPVVTVTPAATATLCLGASQTFSVSAAPEQVALLSQDFNAGLGSWTISNTSGTASSYWQITTAPGAATFSGDGTPYMQAASSTYAAGFTSTILTSPSFSTTGGFGTVQLSFNQLLYSFTPDVEASVQYSLDGGSTWTTIVNQALAVISDIGADGNWSVSQPEYSVPLPGAAMGQPNVRLRFVYNAKSLYWLIDNISVKGVKPAPTFTWSGGAGLSCTNCATSTITPGSTGTVSYNVATTSSAGCVTNTPITLTVNALPASITSGLTVCEGASNTLSSTPGGTWASGNTAIATAGIGTGVLTGVAAGTAAITYTLPTGCRTVATTTVLAAPAAITPSGVATVCLGSSISLSNTTPSGTWASGNVSVAPVSGSGVVSAAATGNANITYTIPNGCIAVKNVTVNPLPTAIGGAGNVCIGASTALTNIDMFGTWTSGNTTIANVNSVSGAVTGVAAGNTFITYTLPTGCYAIKPMQVNAGPLATTGATSVCVGQTAVVSNSTAGGVWTSSAPGIAAVDASGIVTAGSFAGNADIRYTLPATGCGVSYIFTVHPLPATITGAQRVCKDASVTFSNTVPFGTWTSGDASVADVDGSTGVVTGLSTGNTRITYTLPTGCATSRSVTVNPLPAGISGPSSVCYGATISLLNTTPSGNWTSSTPGIATVSGSGIVSPVATSGVATISYVVTATGCYTTRDVVVNPLPAAISGPSSVCNGTSVAYTNADAGGTWSSSSASVLVIGATTGAGTAAGSGTANLVYTLPTGCRTTTSVIVNPQPGDVSGVADVCVGRQSTFVSASTGGNWISSDPTVASITSSGVATGVGAGVTNITYMLPTGCFRTAGLNVNPLPAPITGNISMCVGGGTTLSSADPGGSWSSSNPIVAYVNVLGSVTGSTAGGAVITYTLPTGCMRTQGVAVNPLPAAITGNATICKGQTTDLNITTTGGTWTSEDGSIADVDASTGLVTSYNNGTVNIVYTLPTGCARSRSVLVNEVPTAITGSLTACVGNTSTLASTPVNGVWNTGSSAVAAINSAGMVTANAAGVTSVTYTLPTGCRTTTSFVVNPLPAAITGTRVLCNGATTTLANASAGGNWSTANSLVADIDATSGDLTGNGAGVTMVTYTLPTGCARSANVTVNALPATITGTMAVCEGSTTQLATTSNGGTWSSDNTAVAMVSNSGVVTGITAGGANIAYTLPTGCRTTTAVVVNALPDNITGATSVCLGQQATVLNSTAGGTWTSSNSGIADVDGTGAVTGMGAGTAVLRYTVTATGCSRTKSFVVNPLPAAITGTMSVCQGSTTTLGNASAGGSWSSSNSSIVSISAGGNVAGLAVGFSIITYTLPTGCSVSNTMVVNALPEPITGTAVMCAGGSTTLESATTGGTWSSNNSNASVTSAGVVNGLASGTSVITYMTGNGCRRVRTVTVNALPGLITGAGSVCPGQTLALGNSVSGGTWSSDNTAVATVDVNGVVTPATTAGGTAFIAYTLPTGCVRSRQITVHPAVEAITGTGTICRNGNTTLSNATAGGVWTSSNAAIAAVDAAGVVSGAGAGAATIVYTIPATGCNSEMTVVVNPLPGNISGAAAVCAGSTVVLSNTVPGGSWASSDAAVATISGSGIVTGVATGSAMLTYTLPTGCNVTRSIVVNALPVVKNVTGGGSYCSGGTGVAVGVDGSEAGTIYKLMNGGTTPVITMMGSGTGTVDFGLQTGAGTYMVTAVSAAGCMRDMSGSAVVSVTPLVTPEISMTSDKGSSVCAGTAVTYSAAAVNGGTTPVYEWRVNGAIAGTGASYSYSPADGDVVRVQLTSNAVCPSVSSVSSELTMTVRANLTPAIAVTANPGNSICAGTAVTYSAVGVNGGSAPVYTWVVNGAPVAGATNTVYSYQPSNGDVVLCRLTSSYGCVTTNDVASNSTTMSVAPVFVPEVEVVANPGTVVPAGTEVTFTTVVSNAGPAPTYQWLINAVPVNGATQPIFKTSNLRDGDSVTCRVVGAGACSKATINSVHMTITPATGVGQVNLSGSDLRLYPNPNSGVFEVRGTVGVKTEVEAQLEVTNVLGQVVYRGAARTRGGELEARIDLGGNMANGMYMLNVTVGESRQSFHFVVKQ